VLGPSEDKAGVTCCGRDLGTRLAILLPDPAVDATVDDLEMSAVDLLVQGAVSSVAGVDIRRNVAARRKLSVGRQIYQSTYTHVEYLNPPCTFDPLGQKLSSKL